MFRSVKLFINMIILDTLRTNGSSQTNTHPEVVTFVLRAKLFQEP